MDEDDFVLNDDDDNNDTTTTTDNDGKASSSSTTIIHEKLETIRDTSKLTKKETRKLLDKQYPGKQNKTLKKQNHNNNTIRNCIFLI